MTDKNADQILAMVVRLQEANAALEAFNTQHKDMIEQRALLLKNARVAREALGF